MIVLKKYTFFLFFSMCLVASAQVKEADTIEKVLQTAPIEKPLKYDTNYIHSFGDVVAIEPWISAPSFEFIIEPKQDTFSSKRNQYRPYLRDVLGFDISYRAFSLSVGFRGGVSPGDEEIYGSTRYNVFKLRINSNPLVYELYYNRFKGFADFNTGAYDSMQPKRTPYIKRGDIETQYVKLKALYIFSKKKFSYGAAYSFTQRQKKTKVTLLAIAHIYRMALRADSAFLNKGQENYFSEYARLNNLNVLSVGIGPGFAVTFVEKKWFLSLGLYAIADIQYHKALEDSKETISEGWRAAFLGDVFASAGYNGNKFYAGIVARGDRNMVSLPHINASTSFYTTVFSIGFRFHPPKFVHALYNQSPLRYF